MSAHRTAYLEGMIQEIVDLGLHEDGRGYRTLTIDEIGYDETGKPTVLFGTLDTWHIGAGSDDSFVRGQASPVIIGEHEGFTEPLTNLDRAIEITTRIAALIDVRRELKATFANRDLDGGPLAALDHPLWEQSTAEINLLREQLTLLV
jgi:hypothetical protein